MSEHHHNHHHHDHPHEHSHEHDHHHEHGHTDDISKLKTVLAYLSSHNQEHSTDLQKWLALSRQVHQDDVARELHEVLHLSEQVNAHIAKAIEFLNKAEL